MNFLFAKCHMMKYTSKLAYLLWLPLLTWVVALCSMNVVSSEVRIPVPRMGDIHRAHLNSLYLWNTESSDASIEVNVYGRRFNVLNWLIMWQGNSVLSDDATLVTIWWWRSNTISDVIQSGIWWWESNIITTSFSVIWWWRGNTTEWENRTEDHLGTIAWWTSNKTTHWWTVVWWKNNEAQNWWIVIGWQDNISDSYGVALWQNSYSKYGSFSWNSSDTKDNSAVIVASGWILIWTYEPISWVNLVVEGAMQISANDSDEWIIWEIRMKDGCFYGYDGNFWHVINKNPWDGCPNITCVFWTTLLQEWDSVQAYSQSYAEDCSGAIVDITCNSDWSLWDGGTYYPYCYNLTNNWVLSEGNRWSNACDVQIGEERITIADGESMVFYDLPYGTTTSSCDSHRYTITCNDWFIEDLNPDVLGWFIYTWCYNACSFNGLDLRHWSGVVAYQSQSVPYWSTCQSEVRVCNNGTLGGSYQYSVCHGWCSFNWIPYSHGATVPWYTSVSATCPTTCTATSATCQNWTLSNSINANCTQNNSANYSTYTLWSCPNHWNCTTGTVYSANNTNKTCTQYTRYKLDSCQEGYKKSWDTCIVDNDDKCYFNWNYYNNWATAQWYASTSATCPSTCTQRSATCQNWTWSQTINTSCTLISSPVGSQYTLTSCPTASSVCDSDIWYTANSSTNTCTQYTRYKIAGCKNWYHWNSSYTACEMDRTGWWFDWPHGGWWSVCFLAWTPVFTSEGLKNIEDIQEWDLVLSYNTITHENEYDKVLKHFVHKNSTDDVYILTINWNVLEATEWHPFYVIGSTNNPNQCNLPYRRVSAKDLKVWDQLMMTDGTYVTIEKVSKRPNFGTTYNLYVENTHNYFVGEWYLVHNAAFVWWNTSVWGDLYDDLYNPDWTWWCFDTFGNLVWCNGLNGGFNGF